MPIKLESFAPKASPNRGVTRDQQSTRDRTRPPGWRGHQDRGLSPPPPSSWTKSRLEAQGPGLPLPRSGPQGGDAMPCGHPRWTPEQARPSLCGQGHGATLLPSPRPLPSDNKSQRKGVLRSSQTTLGPKPSAGADRVTRVLRLVSASAARSYLLSDPLHGAGITS